MGLKITVSLGLISVACKSDGAIDKPEPPKNLCVGQPGKEAHAPSPQTSPPTCTVCGPITDYSAIKKGFKQGDGTYALIDASDVTEAKETYANEYKGKFEMVPHPAQQFLSETGPGDTLNYLTPADAGGENHYQLLVKLVESHPELCFASLHTPKSATSLYMLRVKDGVLVMEKRTRTQSLRAVPSVGGTLNETLYAQLDGMLGMFITDYDPATYEDKYRAALAEMIDDAETVDATGTTTTTAPTVRLSDDDLLAKLQALQGKAAKKPAAKKTAAKKAAKSQRTTKAKVETAA